MKSLDCRNQQCPQPVIRTRQQILSEPDRAFQVLVNDPVAVENISRLAQEQGYTVDTLQDGQETQMNLTPGTSPRDDKSALPSSGPTIVLIGSDELGQGDTKLGQILMKNFIFTLTESNATPDRVLFMNAGVKLAAGGSDVLEPLEQLASSGVDIASCGLCLEFFDLKDALAVGRITNMLEIVNTLETAGRIIRP